MASDGVSNGQPGTVTAHVYPGGHTASAWQRAKHEPAKQTPMRPLAPIGHSRSDDTHGSVQIMSPGAAHPGYSIGSHVSPGLAHAFPSGSHGS